MVVVAKLLHLTRRNVADWNEINLASLNFRQTLEIAVLGTR
jgi:hypothetical protein